MIERQNEIVTADGQMNTFIFHPERHSPHPAICIPLVMRAAASATPFHAVWRNA